ncbi:MAG: Fe-S-cluster-containing hydrogenase [Verrucomicrobia bacterium]|nr:Fe-S-cluster-containing hydrogenase [Verrucomicrobiota bacterium]
MNANLTSSSQWRTLDEFASQQQQREREAEFAAGAFEWPDDLSRRRFIKLMAGTLAMAAAGAGTSCTRQPAEEIVPYVRQPEDLMPGRPQYFATSAEMGGEAYGILVRSDSGRPTKIEGNPDHPATAGRSSVHLQAALLTLYDPARSHNVRHKGAESTWEDLLGTTTGMTPRWKSTGGTGLRILTRRVNSPTLQEQISRLLSQYPQARWHEHDAAFPAAAQPYTLHLEKARVILSLDADFLGPGGLHVRNAADFARARQPSLLGSMVRLYAVESMPTMTGTMADHRLPLRPGKILQFARQLQGALASPEAAVKNPWLAAAVKDLTEHREASVVIAGEHQPPDVHAIARAINESLSAVGTLIEYTTPQPQGGSLAELVRAMNDGAVESLIILGGNPVYDSPADLDFSKALARVPFSLHQGLYHDETAALCTWHVPETHFLEMWSDTRAFDGSLGIVQPLIAPLYSGRSAHELLAALLGEYQLSGYDIIRNAWRPRYATAETFEAAWRKTLHDGTGPAPQQRPPLAASAPATADGASPSAQDASLELVLRPDPHLLDGRWAENAWLQELPKPLTKLTWENAAHISPATAARLGLVQGAMMELAYRDRSLTAPVWILPGHADDCVTLHLGHGRANTEGSGFNAFLLQTSDAPWGGTGLTLRRTKRGPHIFSTTQEHQRMEGRDPVHLADIGKMGGQYELPPREDETLYPPVEKKRPAWGMVINLSSCIGCSACTVACQAENNIPVVGREQVLRGREMHWMRVDTYYAGPPEKPAILHQPVPCMHCENAPCEVVCPVAATVHDHEGLNLMVYNRCIGTRYCSNNCPYKVRRFNFLAYEDIRSPQLALMRNPSVSVRMRGVMEKCTYCTQRISAARIEAEKESRPIRDGEVTPACAQACPTAAITFGDLEDPQSRVHALRKSPHHYALLAELNTRPRTTYLSRVQNSNPEMA